MQITRKLPTLIEKNFLEIFLIALLAILYLPVIIYWYNGWLNKNIGIEHEYFSHGIIGLPFAAYLIWLKREIWHKLPDNFHPLGGILLGIGATFYLSGISELVNLSFPTVLAGICLGLKGIPGFKLQGFPLLLILLATPNSIPYLISPYTLPLQKFIASTAGFILIQLGMDVTVEEIYLAVGGKLVEVAPYCAGLKMLFTSLYVALMLLEWTGALASRKKTITLLSGAIIISVTANIIRNTLLTYFHGSGNTAAFTWLHEGWGGDVYSACMLGLIVLLLNLIERFFSTEAETS
ncbi:MAG: cyanoexosortase B [Oscillatoria sp. PMC 1068.18]|nr:cyanoexosortase B [Oscillatoria sp. PMC 1076.18]MEC4990280.1 cyanoexosortase B [Oscillatoria sp. PMC 1068.18]